MVYLNWGPCVQQLSIQKEQLEVIIDLYGQTFDLESEMIGWISVTLSVLERCFSADDRRITQFMNIGKTQPGNPDEISQAYLSLMESYIHEFDRGLIEPVTHPTTQPHPVETGSSDVFIVHGHSELIVEDVAAFIDKLGFKPRIFKREPDRGDTIIEKLERISSEVGFAIVILTGDDFGGIKIEFPDESKRMIESRLKGYIIAKLDLGGFSGFEKPQAEQTLKRAASIIEHLQPRARQNVIFELGYFFGLLHRDNVCVLYEKGVELPSDVQGLMYKPLEEESNWKVEIERELIDWRQRMGDQVST